MPELIHPTAVIDDGAQVGEGTRIWHFSHLMATCRVGERCNIGQNVYIDNNVAIGNGVKIQNNVSVYNGVIIEDDVFLGPSVVFTNVTNPRSFIERKSEFKKTWVRKGASIGANSTILCGVEIGSYAMIGAAAVVVKNVPPHALMIGNPARQIGWVSEAGLTLGFDPAGIATCPGSGQRYQLKDGRLIPL
jgi:UDP-2-acetamido-3-amino-2,3-dideoxy-glucuronate N-acetyltransferase